MKICQVKRVRDDARKLGYEFADVVVETGWLWWRKTKTRAIFKPPHSSYWRWSDTGKFTPESQVEDMVLAAKAREVTP